MVAEHILTDLRSHDHPRATARESVREVVDFLAAYFKREPADS